MSEMPIYVVPYDPSWVDKFESEKASLEQLLAPWRKGPIEHVGSTAVPGLCAKPVIDIMAGVTSLSESEPAKDILRQAGYQYAEYKTDIMHWFCKPSFSMRTPSFTSHSVRKPSLARTPGISRPPPNELERRRGIRCPEARVGQKV